MCLNLAVKNERRNVCCQMQIMYERASLPKHRSRRQNCQLGKNTTLVVKECNTFKKGNGQKGNAVLSNKIENFFFVLDSERNINA